MAKYIAIFVSLLFFVFSVNSAALEPSAEIIRNEDAEEGKYYQRVQDPSNFAHQRRFLETLRCPDPKTDDNTVEQISGDPLHMNNEVKVTCDAGKHFTGSASHKSMETIRCSPLPNPNYEVEWMDIKSYQLMYNFSCTSDVKDTLDNEGEYKSTKDQLPIYPLQDKDNDDPQCPDPTPVRGTIKILHGHPFSYGCNVLLTCDPGLVFEDGKSVWNLTCLGLSVLPPKCVWVPMHDGKPTCKDVLQCSDPSPIRGTLRVTSGTPYTDGCKVTLTCDSGLVFKDGKSVWNLTCVPIPHVPPALIWIPQFNGSPTCKEPEQFETHEIEHIDRSKDTKDEVDQQIIVSRDVSDDPQCPDPTPIRGTLKILSGKPYLDGCSVLLTCDPGLVFADGKSVWNLTCTPLPVLPNKCIWLPQYDGRPTCKEPAESQEGSDDMKNENDVKAVDINSYGPEEDLDGTYHENIIENNNSVEVNDNTNDLTAISHNELNEEFRNRHDGYDSYKSDIEIYDDIINRFENKDYEIDLRENTISDGSEENFETDVDEKQSISSIGTIESSENDIDTEKTYDDIISKPELLSSEKYDEAFPEVEENNDEEEEEADNFEDEPLHEMTDEETETSQEEEESFQIDSEENNTQDNEKEEKDTDEMDKDRKSIIKEDAEHADEEEEEEIYNENGKEEEEEVNEEQEREKNQSVEDVEGEDEEEEEVEENQSDHVDESNEETEVENTEEAVKEDDVSDEEEGDNVEELVENDEETENESKESETLNEEEDIEPKNENEENSSEDKYHIIDDVYPLQPPSIKDHSIIYSALKESSMFNEAEEEEENEEDTNEDHNDNVNLEEVEPPGSLVDIQMFPVEASEEQVQTNENDCTLPAETGRCRAYYKRFFYNSNIGECSMFVYGGCGGNANNFKTLDDCVNTCVKNSLNL